jgi:hypothetical protein
MRGVSHDVIWVQSQIRVIFSDDALKRSGDLARSAHIMRSDRRHYVT